MKPHRRKFGAALAIPVVLVAALYASFITAPSLTSRPEAKKKKVAQVLPSKMWGRVKPLRDSRTGPCTYKRPCGLAVVLGPSSSAKRRVELSNARLEIFTAVIATAHIRDLKRGKPERFFAVPPTPGPHLIHYQGEGLNVVVVQGRRFVPPAATKGALSWLRMENLAPYARIVLFEWYAGPDA